MLIQSRVDGGTPHRCLILWEGGLYMVDAFRGGYNARHVYALRRALGKESLVTQLHAAACGQHRVGNDEALLVDARRCQILHVYAHLVVLLIGIFAIGTHEGVSGMVEDVEEAVVEGQAGTEDGG